MDRDKTIIKTSIKGIIVNIILVAFKAVIGLIVNSIAIILDAVNNLSDALSSIITIIGTKLAAKKPDKKHPYGHGRIEYLASVVIAVIVFVAGLTALKESVEKIINPEEANYTVVSLVIVAVAVVVKFIFGRYVKNIGTKVNSQSLVASGADAIFDSILSFSTLVAGIVSLVWHISLEGILGAIISIFILKSSIEILKETLNDIIGTRVDSDFSGKIKEKVNSFEDVEGCYDLILNNYGPNKIIGSIHVQVPDNLTARQIHALTNKISGSIYAEFGIILTIGIYASNTSDEQSKNIKIELEKIIEDYPEVLQMHGFYVDIENKLVSFDLIMDFKSEDISKIKEEVIEKLKSKYTEFEFNINIDADFSD